MEKIRWIRTWEENICIDLFYGSSNDLIDHKGSIIYAYGISGKPIEKKSKLLNYFVSKGFLFFSPHYYGTYESGSCFNIANSILTITKTIDFIKKGKCKNLWENKNVHWKYKSIFLLGESFGGSVSLIALAKKSISGAVVLGAPIDYSNHGKDYVEENLENLIGYIKLFYPKSWRLCPAYKGKSQEFIRDLIEKGNPSNYLNKLLDRKILAIHGKEDKAVSFKRSEWLIQRLRKKRNSKSSLILLEKTGHINFEELTNQNQIMNKIIKFIFNHE